MIEIWKTIPEFPVYEVSNLGRVKSKKRKLRFVDKKGVEHFRIKEPKIISQNKQNGGYYVVHLHIDNVRKVRTVHSLVMQAFRGKRPLGFEVCHNDGSRTNNRLSNLRYATRIENHRDRIKHGTLYNSATAAKLTPAQVLKIRKLKGVLTQRQIAKKYNMSLSAVFSILNMRSWKYL